MAADPRVALVTAAAGAGIGAATARRLAHDGFDVVVTDAHERRCQQFAGALAEEVGREVSARHLDVSDHDQVRAVMSEVVAVKGIRQVGKKQMVLNDLTPKMEVDPQTYEVRADGELITCEPASKLPLAQRYFLF